MKLWTAKSTDGKPRIALEVSPQEDLQIWETLRRHVMKPGERMATRRVKRGHVFYYMPYKKLEDILMVFPAIEQSEAIKRRAHSILVQPLPDEVPEVTIPDFKGTLFDDQKLAVHRALRAMRKRKGFIINDDMGFGKMQPYDAKVLTPLGFEDMGDLHIGMQITGSDGKPTRVEEIFEHGLQDIYQVTFTDGSSTECGIEHLWSVQHVADRSRNKSWRTMTTEQLLKSGLQWAHGNKWFVPMVKPIEFDNSDYPLLPVHPYVLGLLLGDGGLTGSTPKFSTADEELLKALALNAAGDTIRHMSNYDYAIVGGRMANKLRALNLLGTNSHTKFVPSQYLRGSIQTRVAVLQGLIDTDGYVTAGSVIYSSTSHQLAQDIVFLVESLGGSCRITEEHKLWDYKDGRTTSNFWRVLVRLPDDIEPCRLTRKLANYSHRPKYKASRAISSIDYVGKKECRCIRVAAEDHLYVTDRFIVTHNTYMGAAIALKRNAFPLLITCPNSAKWVWERVLNEVSEGLDIQVIDGTPIQRRAQIARLADVSIINFEALRLHPELSEYEYQMIITDESHNVSNPKAQMTKCWLKLRGEKELMMSGTPFVNTPVEFWPTLHKLFPQRFPNAWAFKRWLVIQSRGKRKYTIGYNPDSMRALREFLWRPGISIRRRIDDLVRPVYAPVEMELNREQRRLYDEIANDLKLRMDNGEIKNINGALPRITRLLQVCFSPELYGGSATSAKVDELMELIKTVQGAGHKAIIFSQWSRATKIIQREATALKVVSAYVDGGVKGNKRMAQVDMFNNDPSCTLYIGTIGANRESISLPAANYVVFTDKVWSPLRNSQALKRSAAGGRRGIGFEGSLHVVDMLAKNTYEQRRETILQSKQLLFNTVVERDGGPVLDTVNMTMEQLREML